MLDRLSSPA